MDKVIVVVGATASQKSKLALQLAKDLETDIISADSFQVYKELNVGINKPSKQEMQQITHHFVDCISIYDEFDVKVYQTWCVDKIAELHQQHKIPIICGGSNLYIDAVIKGYDLNKTDKRSDVTHFDEWTYDEIYQYVLDKDPTEAIKINYNNTKRIIRAAQIIYATEKPKSQVDNQMQQYVYDKFIIETTLERSQLYEKIDQRIDRMLSNGWIDEVRTLYRKDPNIGNLQALKAIGYKNVLTAVIENSPIDAYPIKIVTHHLAKKQITWNRNKYDNVTRFDVDNDDYAQLLSEIRNFIGNTK